MKKLSTSQVIEDNSEIIMQINAEEERLASLSDKLEKTAQWMMEASGKPEFSDRQNVYFPQLNEWRAQKAKVNDLYRQKSSLSRCVSNLSSSTDAAKMMEEKRAIKESTVTSSTYERAQKRLFKQVNGFISGR